MPVKEMDFPSITICRQGLNMDAVQKALVLDYQEWQKEEDIGSQKRRKRKAMSLDDYLSEKYDQVNLDNRF